MRKLLTLLSIFALVTMIGACNKTSSNKIEVEFTPNISNSDYIVKCYHLGCTPEDVRENTYRAMPLGNLLISQNGIIKALQIPYSNGDIKWHEVTYYSIDDTDNIYRCDKTGLRFSNSAKIVYIDLDAKSVGFEAKKEVRIFWN